MKLTHWFQASLAAPGGVSGMITSTRELIEAEIGILGPQNVSLCSTDQREGGQPFKLVRMSIATTPWNVALADQDTVNVVHTYMPYTLHDMKRMVFLAHGSPEYCWWDELLKISKNWWQITTLLGKCEAAVCWFKRDAEFWSELTDVKVHPIRRGVDLGYWSPGERRDPLLHPFLLYADAVRMIKLPFSLLFGVKKAQRVLPYIYLRLMLGDPEAYLPWTNLVTRLNMEHYIPFGLGLVNDPRPLYLEADIGVSPVFWGLVSRVAVEMMACGDPVICFEGGNDDPVYGARVKDSPEGIASGIIRVWDRLFSDPQGEREKARRVAVKEYDIRNTAKSIIKVCESVM